MYVYTSCDTGRMCGYYIRLDNGSFLSSHPYHRRLQKPVLCLGELVLPNDKERSRLTKILCIGELHTKSNTIDE